ncbi:MAG TPA: gamma-glutamylcyclotransferase family protein [Pyrinomonadaceae bacterium]|nr:gamma-glutamylcyclotransferase family protein [Pyrinomonadaceae bacterium]
MSLQERETENLFTYGTLRVEEVQLSTFGRRLEGSPDVLPGYRLVMIRIEDQDFVVKSGTADHRNIQFTGSPSDFVEGIVFKVTKNELEQSDAYEPVGYERVLVRLKSGVDAWVYLNTLKSQTSGA